MFVLYRRMCSTTGARARVRSFSEGTGWLKTILCMFMNDEGFSLDLASLVLTYWSCFFCLFFFLNHFDKSLRIFPKYEFCIFYCKCKILLKCGLKCDPHASAVVSFPQTGASVAHPEDELERLTKKMLFDMDHPPSEEYFGEWTSLGYDSIHFRSPNFIASHIIDITCCDMMKCLTITLFRSV